MTDCMLQITKKKTRFEHFQIMILKKGIKFQIKKKKKSPQIPELFFGMEGQ